MLGIINHLKQIIENQKEQRQLILQLIDSRGAIQEDTYLLSEEVRKILKISIRKLYDLRHMNIIPSVKLGGTVYFRKSDIYSFCNNIGNY